MRRLCYGTYANVLMLCRNRDDTNNAEFHRRLIKPFKEANYRDGAEVDLYFQSSNLFAYKTDIGSRLKEAIKAADLEALKENLANIVKQYIDPNMIEAAVAAIRAIILEDDKIDDSDIVDSAGNLSKLDLINHKYKLNAIDFLAGTFIYASARTKTKAADRLPCKDTITLEFVKEAGTQFNQNGHIIVKDEPSERLPETGAPAEYTQFTDPEKMRLCAGLRISGGDAADYVDAIEAAAGDILDAQIIIRNISDIPLILAVQIAIPDELRFIEGSARLFNYLNQKGSAIRDITQFTSIGKHMVYNNSERVGWATVSYQVGVRDDANLSNRGICHLNIVHTVAGYDTVTKKAVKSYSYPATITVDFTGVAKSFS